MQTQLSLFDNISKTPLSDRMSKILGCDDYRLLNIIAESVINFQKLPQDQEYILSFSGGKDSHVLLAVYRLYLLLSNPPLNVVVKFADTKLEHHSLYKSIYLTKDYCDRASIPFEIVYGKQSYWYVQFAFGYPVPDFRIRWCTAKLKVQPTKNRRQKALTGRHLGESTARDERLLRDNKSCGMDTCGEDLIKDKYDPLLHWRNCDIWDALFYFSGTVLYDNCFDVLQQQYEMAADSKTGSLRLGCFMCPVISLNTIKNKLRSGLIDEEAVKVRYLLEDLRVGRRIKNPRTQKNGAIYVEERRKYWSLLNKDYLLSNNWLEEADATAIDKSLESDYSYPPTYKREWIDLQHEVIQNETKN